MRSCEAYRRRRVTGERNNGRREIAERLYSALADRCQNLEESHARIQEQLDEIAGEKEREAVGSDAGLLSPEYGWGQIPGNFSRQSPFRSLLESLGHAVHVCRASTEEIVYWNRSAEKLFGWNDSEAIGQKLTELIISEEYYTSHRKIMATLKSGQSWAGQFPLKNKHGEVFMAIVTKSPLYEDGELVGIVTVSNDAAIFNSVNSENLKRYQDLANGKDRYWEKHLKDIQWQPRDQLASVPQIASSVSNLKHSDDKFDAFVIPKDRVIPAAENGDFKWEKPATLAAKFLAKLRIKGTTNTRKEDEVRSNTNTYADRVLDIVEKNSVVPSTRMQKEDCASPNSAYQFPRLGFQVGAKASETEALESKSFDMENEGQRLPDYKQFSSSRDSIASHGSLTAKGENDFSPVEDCKIHWEDLRLGEVIGQGSYAIVYRGIWNGSDVAVKVYFWNEYSESILQECKKEIDIMKKLRHPNVLLFMGAVYSHERLAMVTEYLPRGSLFKTLHNNNQTLEIRRRLLMALDVARGLNYLHHRNIVHRDLKSSNLLVDKNWNVKVGDFGLSKLKNATFLSTKSGKGTPQWMAPEVLRNEPSNEKSDVFSYGVVLWELMTESIPWDNLNFLQVVGVVGFMDRRLEVPESVDPQVASIISDCWRSDPGNRPSFEEIIQRMTGLVQKAVALPSRRRNRES